MTSHFFRTYFFRGVPAAPLVVFRILFGLLMIFGTSRFLWNGWVESFYIQPRLHFGYYGFEWVKVLPGDWMYLPFLLIIISALGITFGLFYRVSALLFFLSFTYVELLDKTYYLNHYYFVSLVGFLLIFLPAHADFSLDARRKGYSSYEVPVWTLYILFFVIGIVYFFAGLAKINSDWLFRAQPLKTWLQVHRDLPVIGSFLAEKWVAYLFSWAGCIFDLLIPFLLLGTRTRLIGWIVLTIFHILTGLLFPIGIFPWVMIASTSIFFPASLHEKILRGLRTLFRSQPLPGVFRVYQRRMAIVLLTGVFVFAMLLIPLRHLLYPGNLFWNEEGFRFSWRVMLMDKDGSATFLIHDRKRGGSIEVDNKLYLTPFQEKEMAMQPDMILQYAHFLANEFADTIISADGVNLHLRNPAVTVNAFVTLNGRPHQQFIDPKVDLSRIEYNLRHREWVLPFQGR